MTGDVLFFDFAYEEFLPVIQHAVRSGVRPIMNQPRMRRVLAERGQVAEGFLQFAQPGDAKYASEQAIELQKRFAAAIVSPGAAECFDSSRGNLLLAGRSELVRSVGAIAQNQILINRVLERIVHNRELQAVIMRSCMSSGQQALQACAEKHGIPVIEMHHGNRRRGSAVLDVPWHSAVFGTRQEDIMLAAGVDPERVHVVGAPHWDDLYREEQRPSKVEARKQLGLDPGQPLVVYFGSFATGATLDFADTSLRMMEANSILMEAISSLDMAPDVAVRPHPGESRQVPGRLPTSAEIADFRRWFEEGGVNLVHLAYSSTSLVKDKAALIRAADVVVTHASTVVSEIMILDRPCIILEAGEPRFELFYGPEDGVPVVHDADGLAEQLERLLSEPEYEQSLRAAAQRALPSLNQGHDGYASERMGSLVVEIAKAARTARSKAA